MVDDYSINGVLKILCFKQANQNIIIFLNENLSFPVYKKIVDKINSLRISKGNYDVFEENFIISKGKSKDYSMYIAMIKVFIYDSKVPQSELIKFFIGRLKSNKVISINDAIINKHYENIYKYFKYNEISIKLLCGGLRMDEEQNFAFNVGKIAGKYVKFKRNNHEDNKSLNSILQYSKYDVPQLKFVFQQVSRGIFLSDINESKKQELFRFIKNLVPNSSERFEDENSSSKKDLAYFFYKGVFEELGGDN